MPAEPTTSDRDIRTLRHTLAASQAGDLERAFALAETALADGLTHPLFFKLRGLRRERQGDLEAAAADFRAALADAPNDFSTLNALGLCLAKLGRAGEALAALDVAVALQPGFAPAHFNRGWTLEAVGEPSRARDAYHRALEADPGHVRALAALALIAARAGDPQEARARAARALELDPGEPVAHLALATADLEAGDAAGVEGRVRALLNAPALASHERGIALTVLGDALDDQGRAADAFAAYEDANRTLRDLYASRFAEQGTPTGLALTRRLTAYFSAAPAARWRRGPQAAPADGLAARRHVFLIGFPRSGTTLLGQVLAAHPGVVTLDERETLAEPASELMGDAAGLDRLAAMDEAALTPWRENYWRRIAGRVAPLEGKVFVDKLPMNTLGLPLIAKLFPNAKVLFLRRDPRDVVLSCFRRQFAIDATTYEFTTLEGAGRFYDAVMRLAEVYAEKIEIDIDYRRYEDLVADFEGQSLALCAGLGLEGTPDLTAFAEAAKSRGLATPSAIQVGRGLYGEGVGQWRRYASQLAPVLPILAPWVQRFGYAAA